jgi:hypothetical protein
LVSTAAAGFGNLEAGGLERRSLDLKGKSERAEVLILQA